jgi:GMP synthase-like glutamine amidotransferase
LAERSAGGKQQRMKIAVLETGQPPDNLSERFGRYPAMFQRLLGYGFEVEAYDVAAGEMPGTGDAHYAILITGSPVGVYDPLPWIRPLKEFIREAETSKMVGICFGHQVMAQALGGEVVKSEKGWGTGLQRYEIVRSESWMDEAKHVAVPASHQDQVIVQPPNTDVIASSDFTPLAALSWTDRPAISFQFHPEFRPDFARALIERRRDILPNPDGAIASLKAPNDSALVAGWIRRFLEA